MAVDRLAIEFGHGDTVGAQVGGNRTRNVKSERLVRSCNFPPDAVFEQELEEGSPMNARATILFVALLVAACAANAAAKTYNKSFSITGHPDVHVEADDARVRVTGTDAAQVEVSVEYDGYELGKTLRIEARSRKASKVRRERQDHRPYRHLFQLPLAPDRGSAHAAGRRSEHRDG